MARSGISAQRNLSMHAVDITRRLVAILAADAAGYARLMSMDNLATLGALDGARRDIWRKFRVISAGYFNGAANDDRSLKSGTVAGIEEPAQPRQVPKHPLPAPADCQAEAWADREIEAGDAGRQDAGDEEKGQRNGITSMKMLLAHG
jgi:hypothetical protein